MPYTPPPDLHGLSLSAIAELVAAQKLPPVEQWHPEKCGDSEMRIAADGRWYHQGGEIKRKAMVRAFSTLLRREADGRHVLVTPYEMLDIIIEDAPFLAVEVESDGEGAARRMAFRLNSDHLVIADADHPLDFAETDGSAKPGLLVRGGLIARLARPVYYQLAEWILAEDNDPPGLWSAGAFFPAAPPT
jgi:hypothetical protein